MMIFLADHFSERDNAIAYQFRMLDELRGVAGDSRDQDLPGGEFHVASTTAYPISESVATSPGNVHELAVLRNSAGESVCTIDEPRCSCSRSSVINSAANNAADAKKTESAPRSLCCAPSAAAR